MVKDELSPRIGQMFIKMSMFDSFKYLGVPRPELSLNCPELGLKTERKMRKNLDQSMGSEDFE